MVFSEIEIGKAVEAARLIIRQFLSTSPDDYRPSGYDGEMEYGRGREIVYCVASLWANALACARLIGDKPLEDALVDAFEPYRGEKRHVLARYPHVDYSVVGIVPLEIAVLRGDERALALGLPFADAQWAEPQPDDPIPPRSPSQFEMRLEWWRLGYSPETRLWIDDTYMIAALQTASFRATGKGIYLDRAMRELSLYVERLRRPDGLYRHQAEDAPLAWSRGNGWMAAALALLIGCTGENGRTALCSAPRSEDGRTMFGQSGSGAAEAPATKAAFSDLASVLLRHQRGDGLWGQLVDNPASWTESSGSAMFAFSLAEGVRLGILDAATFAPAVLRAWEGLLARLDANGNLDGTCEGTGPSGDPAYYLSRKRSNGDPHGQAAFLWLCRSMLSSGLSEKAIQNCNFGNLQAVRFRVE